MYEFPGAATCTCTGVLATNALTLYRCVCVRARVETRERTTELLSLFLHSDSDATGLSFGGAPACGLSVPLALGREFGASGASLARLCAFVGRRARPTASSVG